MKKKYQKMLLIVTMMLLLCGCQKEESTADTSAKKDTTSETTASQKEEGTFSFEEACKQIVIDGKQVELPFTLDDLGEEYSYDEDSILEYGDQPLCTAHIVFPEKGDLYVILSEQKAGDVDRKSQIVGVNIRKQSDKTTLYGFETSENKLEIVEKLGEPTEIVEDDESGSYYYKDETGYIQIFFMDDKVENILMRKY